MKSATLAATLAAIGLSSLVHAQGTRLLRQPDISETHIVFAYANDIWLAPRDGGDATRLTSFQGAEADPHFSPDGTMVAFSGQYDGNTDVYVVSVEGGSPQRLTWHPGGDTVKGWTNDGTKVIFASSRDAAPIPLGKFWTIALDGAMPEPLPMPRVENGNFSPDGGAFAYQPITQWDEEWRNYRGGQVRPIWLLDMATFDLQTIGPWDGSNDIDPVWIGDTVYFLSDRDWAMNVWAYDTNTGDLEQLTYHRQFDAKHLNGGGGALVYECGGYLCVLEPNGRTPEPRQVEINVRGDMSWARPHWETVDNLITAASISPTGKRAVFEARGEIFTVPAEKGDWRNLTRSSGVADRNPTWSPDGEHIAWFSDDGGEYALYIGTQDGLAEPRRIELDNPTFYFTPAWSPDSKKILFTDEGLNLSYVDVESGEQHHVDTDQFAHPQRTVDPVWSPDSNWIAYAKRLDNQYHAIMVYSLADGSVHQVTDGMSDAISPAWDRNGKYLYFLASTNYALNTGWLDMSSYDRPLERAIYFAVLQSDEPSPLLPESDEEEIETDEPEEDEGPDDAADADAPAAGDEAGDAAGDEAAQDEAAGDEGDEADEDEDEEPEPITIDFDGIDQRILALPVGEGEYQVVTAGPEGVVFYGESREDGPGLALHRFSMEDREANPFLSGINGHVISSDGKKMLYNAPGGTWGIVDTTGSHNAGDGRLSLNLRMKVDPQEEWKQMFDEAWRFQRDFLYVENVHGADWDQIHDWYEPWVQHVRHRSDLSHLLDILGGEVAVGHSFTSGGDTPDVEFIPIGLLGADIEIADGRYRIARIYTGENWNPDLRAPLSAPGIDVSEGEYIVGVNGVELDSSTNFYSAFEATANRQTVLHVNGEPTMDGARTVTVVPVASENALRSRAWVEGNRRKVDELSGGKLAYVWLPNTGGGGYTYFNRYYFAQQHKQGAIIDERFNGGGSAADYMVDIMSRKLKGFFNNPVAEKKPFTNPGAGIWGPKVMIANEAAGSGGDLLPYMFKHMEIGPVVGTRTWGGLVGIWDVPSLIDGGRITAPRGGFYDNEGKWDVENVGVAPDIHVEMTPKEVIAGGDPQLERAVEVALRLLEEGDWPEIIPQPPDPVRARRPDR